MGLLVVSDETSADILSSSPARTLRAAQLTVSKH